MTQSNDPRRIETRPVPYKEAPGVMKAMLDLSAFVDSMSLERSLQELVKIRASQINGCANCLAMHTRDARAAGESEERLHLVAAWREAPVFTPRERAALAWTEALTLIAETHAPDDVFAEVRQHFKDDELTNLTVLIGLINLWNRLAIGFRNQHPVGDAAPMLKAQTLKTASA